MNSFVEKLAAIEKEVAAIQPKMVPLTERIADLDQKVAGFARQLAGIAEESASVKQDIELTQQSFARIQTLIGESKVESEQLVAGQEENQQRCETMTAVFGAAFQAMSQFFETAQRMGLADQAKAVFLAQPSVPATFPPLPATAPATTPEENTEIVHTTEEQQFTQQDERGGVRMPVLDFRREYQYKSGYHAHFRKDKLLEWSIRSQNAPELPTVPEPVAETIPTEESAEPPPMPEPVAETIPTEEPVEPPPMPEPVAETVPTDEPPEPPPMSEPVAETVPTEKPAESQVLGESESILSESDFYSAMPDAGEEGLDSWSVPSLPDVAALPEMSQTDFERADAEPSDAMASHLDVPPLNLSVPALPEQNESAPADEMDDQEIEALLASMMTPVTAEAGG